MTLYYTKSPDLHLIQNFKPRFAVVFVFNKSFYILYEYVPFLDYCANHWHGVSVKTTNINRDLDF